MNPTATKVVAGVVLFLSGAVMGYFGSRLLVDRGKMAMLQHGDPRHFAEMFLRRMTGDLDLSEAQQAKLRPIVMGCSKNETRPQGPGNETSCTGKTQKTVCYSSSSDVSSSKFSGLRSRVMEKATE